MDVILSLLVRVRFGLSRSNEMSITVHGVLARLYYRQYLPAAAIMSLQMSMSNEGQLIE